MLSKNPNRKAQVNNETGLGTNTALSGGRFFNKNGVPNMEARGLPFWQRLNIYHSLLSMPRWKFLTVIILFFVSINLIFACLYLFIGINHLGGMVASNNAEKFGEAFFFSAQTFTTVGYGRINPIGFSASLTASLEALIGLMSFALVTGLLYGRFARPRAYIRYSKNALFVPFRDGVAVMFRMVPYTKNYLLNVEAKVTLALKIQEDGQMKNKFFNMPLDIAKATTMTANWTLVHMINEESHYLDLVKKILKAHRPNYSFLCRALTKASPIPLFRGLLTDMRNLCMAPGLAPCIIPITIIRVLYCTLINWMIIQQQSCLLNFNLLFLRRCLVRQPTML